MGQVKVTRIDEHWNDVSREEDLARFREQDVEFLLDQSADLLDRILRDQSAFDELGEKLFEMTMIEEQIRTLKSELVVKIPKIASGGLPTIVINDESFVLEDIECVASHEESLGNKELVERLNQRDVNLANLRRPFQDQGTREYWKLCAGDAAAGYKQGAVPPDAQFEGAKLVREHDLYVLDEQTSAAQQEAWSNEAASIRRARALELRSARDHAIAALEARLRQLRVDASKEEGSALNFNERREALMARIDADFEEVKARVEKAAKGLKTIYSYGADLPSSDTSLNWYDRYAIAVRKAISFLANLTRRDQSFVLTISLKQLLGEQEFTTNFGRWALSLTPKKIYFPPEYNLIRLRGAALSLITRVDPVNQVDSWSGDISVSTKDKTASCHAGRISLRQPLKEPDLLGEVLLHNLSPFTVSFRQGCVIWHSVSC